MNKGIDINSRLARIQNWEQLALEAQFRPAIMAALCPVSLRQLERFFLHHFKQTPSRWTRELRCRLACQIIARGWSSKAVAQELYFANESHLCHEFKKFLGVTPQAYSPLYGLKSKPDAKLLPLCAPALAMSSANNNVAFRQ